MTAAACGSRSARRPAAAAPSVDPSPRRHPGAAAGRCLADRSRSSRPALPASALRLRRSRLRPRRLPPRTTTMWHRAVHRPQGRRARLRLRAHSLGGGADVHLAAPVQATADLLRGSGESTRRAAAAGVRADLLPQAAGVIVQEVVRHHRSAITRSAAVIRSGASMRSGGGSASGAGNGVSAPAWMPILAGAKTSATTRPSAHHLVAESDNAHSRHHERRTRGRRTDEPRGGIEGWILHGQVHAGECTQGRQETGSEDADSHQQDETSHGRRALRLSIQICSSHRIFPRERRETGLREACSSALEANPATTADCLTQGSSLLGESSLEFY